MSEKVSGLKEKNELLNKFIEEERAKSRLGSGDDMFFEQQIMDYVNKQRPLWIEFIKFIESKKVPVVLFECAWEAGLELGKVRGKKEMLEWLEKEFAKHDGIIVNTFKKEIMKKAKKQEGEK